MGLRFFVMWRFSRCSSFMGMGVPGSICFAENTLIKVICWWRQLGALSDFPPLSFFRAPLVASQRRRSVEAAEVRRQLCREIWREYSTALLARRAALFRESDY